MCPLIPINQMTEEDIKLNYITPALHNRGWKDKITMETKVTDGKVNLVIGETLQGKAVVEVYNLLGERMMAKSIGRLQKGETINLDLSHLVSGLYIIKLSTESWSCTKKVSVW